MYIQEEKTMAKEKVVLAYSGGLDTSVIMTWLKENYDYDVIAVCCNAGQKEDFDAIEKKALATGAIKAITIDLREEFITDYIWPTLKAGAIYENEYMLGTSMARPLMAKKLVEVAEAEGAFTIAHGCTGKGNDQIRFELGIKALAPDLKIIAPWRMTDVWTMQSREEEIEYCKQHGIDLPFDAKHSYSRDRNLWHISHEGLELEDPANEPNYDDLLVLGVTPEKAPDEGKNLDKFNPLFGAAAKKHKTKRMSVLCFYMYLLLCLIPRSSSCIIPDIVRQNSSMKNLCSSHVLRSYSSHVFCHNKFFPHNELY